MSQSIGANRIVGNEFFLPVRRKTPVHIIFPTIENDTEEIINVRLVSKTETKTIAKPFGKLFFSILASLILISYSLFSIYSFIVIANNAKLLAAHNLMVTDQKILLSIQVKHRDFLKKLNTIENQSISITANGNKFVLSSADITSMLDLSKVSGNKLSLNQTAIKDYIDNLTNKVNVSPINRTLITHTDGSTVLVNPGSNGFKIDANSINSLTQNLNKVLLNGSGSNFNLNGVSVPFATDNTAAGYKYLIEGNLTTKILYAYQDGVLIRSFPMSAGKPSTPTPVGTFTIWDKIPSVNMWGYNPNGTMYTQPNVPYVMYFDKNGDAVHGNYWRPASVFGNVNTSHGCMGLNINDNGFNDAKWMYDWAPIGTTVVTHY